MSTSHRRCPDIPGDYCRTKNIQISRSSVSSGPKKSNIFGSEKIENFRSRNFSFSYNFNEKKCFFSNSKKFEKYFRFFRKFLRSKIFIENCMKMKNFEIENFRKISISKIFKFSTLSCSNFLSNQYFLIFFLNGSM